MSLVKDVYLLTSNFPKEEKFGLISQINIHDVIMNIQISTINYIQNIKHLIKYNNEQIENLNNIIKNNLYNIDKENVINLIEICKISHNKTSNNDIIIHKNSLLAGKVEKSDTIPNKSDNLYYIDIFNQEFLPMFIYYFLKYNENEFMKFAKINNSINLSKKYIETFKIPKIIKSKQEQFINICDQINNMINFYNDNNNNYKNNINIYLFNDYI